MLIYYLKPSFKKSKDSGNREDWDSFKSAVLTKWAESVTLAIHFGKSSFFVKIPFLKETFRRFKTERLESYQEKT